MPWLRLFIAVLVLSGCKSRDKQPRIRVSAAADLEKCISALDTKSQHAGGYLAALASGCSAACPKGFPALASAIDSEPVDEESIWSAMSQCDLACSPNAKGAAEKKPAPDRLTEMVGQCGVAYYHLPSGYDAFLSDASFIAAQIHQWLDRVRATAPEELRSRLKAATTRAHIVLPPPAQTPMYRLPHSAATTFFSSKFYLVVGESEVRAAAPPVTRLLGSTLEMRPVPGGKPPGTVVEPGRERESLSELEKAWRSLHTGHEGDNSYTYMSDAATSVERLLTVAKTVGHQTFRIGVAGLSTREHRVEVAVKGEMGSAAPVMELRNGDLSIPEKNPDASVTRALRAALVERAPSAVVELRVAPGTSVAELIRALDVAAAARADQVILSILDG